MPVGAATVIDTPPELDLGSVVDDAKSAREFLSRQDNEFVAIWHEADHIAGVLRSIARLDLPHA